MNERLSFANSVKLMCFPSRGCLHLSWLSHHGVKGIVPVKAIPDLGDRKAKQILIRGGYHSWAPPQDRSLQQPWWEIYPGDPWKGLGKGEVKEHRMGIGGLISSLF